MFVKIGYHDIQCSYMQKSKCRLSFILAAILVGLLCFCECHFREYIMHRPALSSKTRRSGGRRTFSSLSKVSKITQEITDFQVEITFCSHSLINEINQFIGTSVIIFRRCCLSCIGKPKVISYECTGRGAFFYKIVKFSGLFQQSLTTISHQAGVSISPLCSQINRSGSIAYRQRCYNFGASLLRALTFLLKVKLEKVWPFSN